MRSSRRCAAAVVAAVLVSALALPVRAYDPATTHAGLTEKAVLASALHRLLAERLGRSGGLMTPLQIHSRTLEPAAREALWRRFEALDPAGGYRPAADGTATALMWVVAGAVLAETPPERGRHHFLDPRTRSGLHDAPGLSGLTHAFRMTLDGAASIRHMAAGTAFDLTGQSSLEWLRSPQNDLGLPVFLDAWEQAVAAPEPALREAALARALMALGGMAALLQDAGEPAHVRNDFRATFLRKQGPSTWDRSSSYERFVARQYGRAGVPAAGSPVRRPTLESFFVATDGKGLAERTQRRFFSEGTVPAEVGVDRQTTTKDVIETAQTSLELDRPRIGRLELRQPGKRQYLQVEGRRALAYERLPARVRFFLDDAVYADSARALLPEIGAYTAGFIDHLIGPGLIVEAAAGGQVAIALAPAGEGAAARPAEGTLRVFGENAQGQRREIARPDARPLLQGERVMVQVPPGLRRVGVTFRVGDDGGSVRVGEAAIP